jgi:hypothetical protein
MLHGWNQLLLVLPLEQILGVLIVICMFQIVSERLFYVIRRANLTKIHYQSIHIAKEQLNSVAKELLTQRMGAQPTYSQRAIKYFLPTKSGARGVVVG